MHAPSSSNRNTIECSRDLVFTRRWEPVQGETLTNVNASHEDNRELRVFTCLRDNHGHEQPSLEGSEWFRLFIENVQTIVDRSLVHPADQSLVKAMISGIIQPEGPVTPQWMLKETIPWSDGSLLPGHTGDRAIEGVMTSGYDQADERLRRTEILLNTKENIQKEKSWEKGLKITLECISKLGFESYGIVLVNPLKRKLELHSGKGITIPEDSMRSKYSEYSNNSTQEKKITLVKEPNGENYMWVPVVVQGTPFVVLVADTMGKPSYREEIEDLKFLADIVSAFIDRTTIRIEPMAEKKMQTTPKYRPDPTESYIVLEKRCEKALEIFYDLVTHGTPGIVVSRVHPERLKERCTLTQTPVVWLSQSERGNTVTPNDLYRLAYALERFTRRSTRSVILFDGLEYLMTQTSFEKVLMYVQELKDIATVNNSQLIVPLHKDALSPREYGLLQREFKILKFLNPFSVLTGSWNRIKMQRISPLAISFIEGE